MIIDRDGVARTIPNDEIKADALDLSNLAGCHIREFNRIDDTGSGITIKNHVRAISLAEPVDVSAQATLQQVVTQSAYQQIGTSIAVERVRAAFAEE